MPAIVEREIQGWGLPASAPKAGASITSFTLQVTSPSSARFNNISWTLDFPLANAYRAILTGPTRPRPPHDNIILRSAPLSFTVTALDAKACKATFAFPPAGPAELDGSSSERTLELEWHSSLVLSSWETTADGRRVRILGDLANRSYALTDKGVLRHWWYPQDHVHLGMGEKAGPLDLSGRSFQMHGQDSAVYDAYESDPLYKHTPYLISSPKPTADGRVPSSSYAIFHGTNSHGVWDLGRTHDDPSGYFKMYQQDFGGLEEWVLVGKGVKEIVRTFGEMVGMPKLVGRDWLGYLASGMGLGESDEPIAQTLLEGWPELCKKHDIPCSAMHLSSGYTVEEATGDRMVFGMNKKRYPDFKGMVKTFHKAGIKVVPNIKPYLLGTHPAYERLRKADAFFVDPDTEKPVTVRIWSSGVGTTAPGGWSDQTSEEGRKWWGEGVQSLIDLGCDGMWNDNNEYYLRDDDFLARNQAPHEFYSPSEGKQPIGLLGRMINTEMMAYVSETTLKNALPDRRTYVLTRSGNVGTFKYACSTWSGDNYTSWHNLRGSQPIQLNAGMSLLQAYGSDVGGFGGPLPTPELFVRWVQLGVTHSRFCIHSYKPNKEDPSGAAATNLPWMYPEVLPIIRREIKWRYTYLPFFNSLMWESHEHATPTNAWLGFGPFASDPELYTDAMMRGFDAWIGCGQLLSVPALFEGMLTREVYFPKASAEDESVYFDLHAPHAVHRAGTRATVATPLEHMGLFAREGAVIPIGKDRATVTQQKGPARTTPDGVDVQLESDGGQVALDDWRGVQIFPAPADSPAQQGQKTYTGRWTEDDGISANPEKAVVQVTYEAASADEIRVQLKWLDNAFKPLWGETVHIILPANDRRKVAGADEVMWEGRPVFALKVEALG